MSVKNTSRQHKESTSSKRGNRPLSTIPTQMIEDAGVGVATYEDERDYREFVSRRKFGVRSPLLNQLRVLEAPTDSDESLILRLREGDKEASFLLLCKHYKYIVAKIIEITNGHWYSDDILQAGALGLYEAAIRFDLDRKHTFLTYAHYWILKYLYIAIRDDLLPLGGLGIGRDYKERLFNFIKYTMMGLSDSEIMERLNINSAKLIELKILNNAASRMHSLDTMVSANPEDDDLDPLNAQGIPTHNSAELEYINHEFMDYVEDKLEELSATDKMAAEVACYRLGLRGYPQLEKAEICTRLSISKRDYEVLKRSGNRFLKVQMIHDGWYDAKQSEMLEVYKWEEEQAKKDLQQ